MSRLPDVWIPRDQKQFEGPILLDTHIWLWYLDGAHSRIGTDAIALLRRCAGGGGLRVSNISVWEIGNKVSKGTLNLSPELSRWLDVAGRKPGFAFLPLDRDVLLYSTRLPGNVHGDPADRMLVATAVLSRIPLITADRLIVEYAKAGGELSVCDARR